MSVIATLKQIKPELLSSLLSDHTLVEEIWYGDDEGDFDDLDEGWDLDKSWHAIHFMLTSSVKKDGSILSKAVLGGKCIDEKNISAEYTLFPEREYPKVKYLGEDVYIGVTYYLIPEEVVEVAKTLSVISENDLRKKYDPVKMNAANIYPGGWEDQNNDELEGYYLSYFRDFVAFYQDAAHKGNGVLVSLG